MSIGLGELVVRELREPPLPSLLLQMQSLREISLSFWQEAGQIVPPSLSPLARSGGSNLGGNCFKFHQLLIPSLSQFVHSQQFCPLIGLTDNVFPWKIFKLHLSKDIK